MTKEYREYKGSKAHRGSKAYRGPKAHRGSRAHRVFWVPREHREYRESKAHRGCRAYTSYTADKDTGVATHHRAYTCTKHNRGHNNNTDTRTNQQTTDPKIPTDQQ